MRTYQRTLGFFLFICGIGVATILSGLAHSIEDRGEVSLGLPVSLSGNWAMLGNEIFRGATLATEEINEAGGVNGRRIKLAVQDSDEAVSPAKLLRAYQYLKAQGVTIFIGPTGTPGGLALAPVAERDDVLLIAPAVGVSKGFQSARGNIFNVQGGWESASRLLAQRAYALGYRKMAIFSSTHPFEKTQGDVFQAEFERLGGEIVARVDPQPDTTDLSTEASIIVQSHPDAVFHSGYNQMANAARRLRELGFKNQLFAIQIDPSRLVGAADALNGAIYARLASCTNDFVKRYNARFNEAPNYPADFGYDAVKLFAYAAKEAGSFDPASVAKVIVALKWHGASGDFEFDEGGSARRTPTLWRVEGGTFRMLSP